MLVNFIFILLFTGIISFFSPQKRSLGLWTILLGASFLYGLSALVGKGISPDISIIWNAMPDLSISINLNPLHAAKIEALGVVVISFLSFYYNLLSPDETEKNKLNGLVAINCVLMLVILCSTNYIQLLASIGMADVIIYSVINCYNGKRQYIYSNFFADFLLLNILAIILGQHGNINIMRLEDYSSDWHHRDYIAIMLLICVFIKSGIALFHTAYQKISTLSSNRINFIMYGATPLVGIIILDILHNLLSISQYSFPLLRLLSAITVLWGCLGAILITDIKRKSVYMSMLFWGLSFSAFAWLPSFSEEAFFTFLGTAFLFNCTLDSLRSRKNTLLPFLIQLSLTIFAITIYMLSWWKLASLDQLLAIIGLCILMFTSSSIVAERCINAAPINNSGWRCFFEALPILTAITAFIMFNIDILNWWPYIITALVLWLICVLSNPLFRIKQRSKSEFVQNGDFVTSAYSTFIFAPLQIIGRVLRLTVDIVFFERTVITSIRNAIHFFIYIFRKLHANILLSSTIFMVLGVFIIIVAYFNGVTK